MKYVGIIAEYNPFHSGHGYQITQTKQQLGDNTTIIVIMSGNWVQQAYCAITDKWTRSSFALAGGADLVLELPTPWATASAQKFARGAIALLEATGLVTHLSFGSEQGELETLQTLVSGLNHPDFPHLLKQELKSGISFPVAREKALSHLVGAGSILLQKPNNILGLEYLSALDHYQSNIQPITIPRKGASFHSLVTDTNNPPLFTSATDLRDKIKKNQEGNLSYLNQYLNPTTFQTIKSRIQSNQIPNLDYAEKAILAKLYTMSPSDWSTLPDSGTGEGLPHRLTQIAQDSATLEEFLQKAKTKRYTHARLRRLVLHAFLNIPQSNTPPAYLRILAMNQQGTKALKQMKKTATLPLLTKPAQIHTFPNPAQALFQQEVKATNLYNLCFQTPQPPNQEFKKSPIFQ